ncbi:MAG TPA: FUSC family protein [Kofleriaceae bacterium]|nr:FUSC family protein [Kofleriaceae bacterium]
MQVDLERVKQLAREAARLQPGRPALWVGLRAALAVAAPMLIAARIHPLVMTWATLGGYGVVLVDKGGAYRTRAIAMLVATLGGALGALVGTLAADSHVVPLVVAVGTAICAMAATWPGPAVAVGNTVAVQLIVATTLPHDPARPWLPALGFVAGGAWTLVLALLLWPVRIYRPARLAAMRCVRELARHATEIAARDDGDPASWRDAVTRRHRAIRETLEAARAVLAATRRGRRGEIGRGERLLLIVEAIDPLFGVLIGVEEVADHLGDAARTVVDGDLRAGLTIAGARLDEIADRLTVEDALPPLPPLARQPSDAVDPRLALDPLARAEVDHARSLIRRIFEDVAVIGGVVDSLASDGDPAPALASSAVAGSAAAGGSRWAARIDALRGSLDRDSAVLRHAVRVALVALAAMAVTRALHLERAYWATLTAVLLLQPYLPATITRGLQRVGGTILGGLIAAAITTIVRDPLGIAIAAFGFAAISAAVLQLNYGLYALFLTPTFILLAEVHARDTHLVELRVINTLLGAGLAVIGAIALWPSRESARAGDRLADALDAAAGYAREVFGAVAGQAPPRAAAVIAARRRAGRALNNADLSLDRLAAEGPPPQVLESHMALATMTRRLAATLSAFATARHVADPGDAAGALAATGADVERSLRGLAEVVRGERSTPAPPSYQRREPPPGVPELLAARLARIDLQLAIIAEAAARTAVVR